MKLIEFDRLLGDAALNHKQIQMLILPDLAESKELEKDVTSGFGLMEVSRKTHITHHAEQYKLYGHRKVMELLGVEIFVPDWD